MSTRPSPTPPALGRPKNAAANLTPGHASSSSSTNNNNNNNNLSQQPASMTPAARAVRGTTPSRAAAAAAVEGDKPARPASKDSLKQKMARKPDESPKPSRADEVRLAPHNGTRTAPTDLCVQQLKALKADFDGLRSHLTCKICVRLFYQPYTIACGHTYCYSCLCTWFVANKARKTCPDCRAVVSQIPAPAYVLRDMTTLFVSRPDLLPPGETVENHAKCQQEEADAVQQDKDNPDPRTGGLFKGCFSRSLGRIPTPHLRAIRDQEDGVDRCPLCNWELEDGECGQCGLFFNDNGEVTWNNSFNGFSDMDETSERDLSGEDLDIEFDMDDGLDGYDDQMDGWEDYLGDETSYMMQRYLQHGIPPQAGFRNHRRMTHSEAGSRRSYSQSIVSDMYTDEMDTVEEEDEEGADEDSSMNDFIDDDGPQSHASTSASSTPGQTPQPPTSRARLQGRARRIVESEASSSISSVPEDEEEDEEEDQGPIRRGQRNRAQNRLLNRANGSREPSGPPSSTSTDASHEQELDEDTQALLQADGWMLQHDGPDEEMYEDDDSDGGRTTIGCDTTAVSNDRLRLGGSLTPTADRPRPDAGIRPPSRSGTRFMDASRGLRRRSSVLSTSTAHYEDGEADDDDSDPDPDGDVTMAMNSLRARRSRAHMRNAAAFNNPIQSRFHNRGFSQENAIDLDADDHSDDSQRGGNRRYNPRISWMFADHQRSLQEFQGGHNLVDLEPRSITPITRPRTANRNRPSPAQQFSPFMAPAPTRLRTPLMDNSLNMGPVARMPTSPRRAVNSASIAATNHVDNYARDDRASSISSASNASVIYTPGTTTPSSEYSANSIAQAQAAAAVDMIDRPPSRISARPPSTTGRRNPPTFSPVYPSFPHTNVGLNLQGRFVNQRAGNPWGAYVQPNGIRSRTSRPALRDQSSTATLRASNSRANIRDGGIPPQGMRVQSSRINLRAQPSQRRLNSQASSRTLRASDQARPPQSPVANAGAGESANASAQPPSRPTRITPDERDARARELINTRMRALGNTSYQPGAAPVRTNPFTAGFRRPSGTPELPVNMGTTIAPQHIRSNSNESMTSVGSSHTAQATPPSPVMTRRRSNRNMVTGPPPAMAQNQATFAPVGNGYANSNNTYFRGRQGSLTGGASAYESPLNQQNARSPMVAATGQLI
ncbi:hypothetical protein K491DRAFT_683175 [Lophiostoma macrostomum CBS 122681]|uniref:RING-type domain-containing protein n=1 Tax=Lophiostoma macrostomum CBS 122681 TaxID=1314788 RepID=A0A6A6STC1_9PLEO|nr:hypothetical protein K491DRAFT_683175 [Lophiostoma macrostomum CBS 122681]